MSTQCKNWEEKIRKDYRGIISEAQIEATIDYWRDFIRQMHNQAREEERKRLRERIMALPPLPKADNKERLAYESAVNQVLAILEEKVCGGECKVLED